MDQHKLSLIAEFLKQSFAGCTVSYDSEDREHVDRSYRIIDDATGSLRHIAVVTRAFLNDHAEAEIVPALQSLAFLVCLRMAGNRRVVVKSQMIELEAAA